jgi:hypothetical protein
VRNPQGYAAVIDPSAQTWERDTVTCGHCSAVVFVKPGTASTTYLVQQRDAATGRMVWAEEPGAFCRVCMRSVCLRCHSDGGCRPLEAWLESQETGRPRRLVV